MILKNYKKITVNNIEKWLESQREFWHLAKWGALTGIGIKSYILAILNEFTGLTDPTGPSQLAELNVNSAGKQRKNITEII